MSDKQPTISKKELIETCGYISQTRLNQWLTSHDFFILS